MIETLLANATSTACASGLSKTPAGLRGLYDITFGGLPAGLPALWCGGAGCGATLLAMEILVRGAVDHGEPGVTLALDGRPAELMQNMHSLGFDLQGLVQAGRTCLARISLGERRLAAGRYFSLEGEWASWDRAGRCSRLQTVLYDSFWRTT